MADVFTTSKFSVTEDPVTEGLTLLVELPKPNGPLVFGMSRDQAKDLLSQLKVILTPNSDASN